MAELKVGQTAPDFELIDVDGKPVKLSDFRGQHVVVVFYRLDFSPVCGNELTAWREHAGALKEKGAILIGISVDSRWAHRAYAESLKLPAHYKLLSDFPNHQGGEAYGAWDANLKLDDRVTVVVDPEGKIAYVGGNKDNKERDPNEALAAIR